MCPSMTAAAVWPHYFRLPPLSGPTQRGTSSPDLLRPQRIWPPAGLLRARFSDGGSGELVVLQRDTFDEAGRTPNGYQIHRRWNRHSGERKNTVADQGGQDLASPPAKMVQTRPEEGQEDTWRTWRRSQERKSQNGTNAERLNISPSCSVSGRSKYFPIQRPRRPISRTRPRWKRRYLPSGIW